MDPKETGENLDTTKDENSRDREICEAVERILAEKPQYKGKLFLVELPGSDEFFIARMGTFERIAEYGELFGDPKAKMGKTAISFLQEFVVFPNLDYEDLAYNREPGDAMALLKAVQEFNGLSKEATIKKL